MSVRMRMTSSKVGSRRAHHQATTPRVVRDKETGKLGRRHFMDPETGLYRGNQVKKLKRQATKAETKDGGDEKTKKEETTKAKDTPEKTEAKAEAK